MSEKWIAIATRGGVWQDDGTPDPKAADRIRAFQRLGLKVRLIHWSVVTPSTGIEVALQADGIPFDGVAAAAHGEAFYFDPSAFGWPGWGAALLAASGGPAVVVDEEEPQGEVAIGQQTAARYLNIWTREMQQELEKATTLMVPSFEACLRTLDEAAIATPEAAEELMFQEDAGRLLTNGDHERVVESLRAVAQNWNEARERIARLAAKRIANRETP